jgi:hypothetical protein
MFKWYKKLKPSGKIAILSSIDLILSWLLPSVVVATEYKLFEADSEPRTKATAITYILLISLIGGIIWRAKEIVTLTRSNGIKYALTKGITPFLFLIFWFVLGNAEAHIDRLRNIFFWAGIFHFVALYFRFRVGQLTKIISNQEIVNQVKAAMKP